MRKNRILRFSTKEHIVVPFNNSVALEFDVTLLRLSSKEKVCVNKYPEDLSNPISVVNNKVKYSLKNLDVNDAIIWNTAEPLFIVSAEHCKYLADDRGSRFADGPLVVMTTFLDGLPQIASISSPLEIVDLSDFTFEFIPNQPE